MVEKTTEEKVDYKYLAIVASAAGLITLILIFTLGQYSWGQMQKAIAETKTQQQVLASDTQRLNTLTKLSAHADDLKAQNAKVLDALPQDKDVSGLFVQFGQIAGTNGMSVDSVSETSTTSTAATSSDIIKQLSYDVNAKATNYGSLKESLSKFENALRLLSIPTLEITDQNGSLGVKFGIVTYTRSQN